MIQTAQQKPEQIYFWSLRRRFLDDDDDMPDSPSKQVMYYSLAIGHHVGMIDCMHRELVCGVDEYIQWIQELPEGEARRKFMGLIKFGEIMIDSTHARMLHEALKAVESSITEEHQAKHQKMIDLMSIILLEPVVYLIAKKK